MKIIIEMPEPRSPQCPFCSEEHHPKEVCQGLYLEPDYEGAAQRAKALEESANIVEKDEDEDN